MTASTLNTKNGKKIVYSGVSPVILPENTTIADLYPKDIKRNVIYIENHTTSAEKSYVLKQEYWGQSTEGNIIPLSATLSPLFFEEVGSGEGSGGGGGSLNSSTTILTGDLTPEQEATLADNTIHRNVTTKEVWIKAGGIVTKLESTNEFPTSEIVVGLNDVRTDYNIRPGSEQIDVNTMVSSLPPLKPNLNSTIPNPSVQHKISLKSGVYPANFVFDKDPEKNTAPQGLKLESTGNRLMTVLTGSTGSTVPVVKVTDTTLSNGDPLASSNAVADGANAKTQGFELNNLTVIGDNTTARAVDVFVSGFRSKDLLVQSTKKPIRVKFSGSSNGGNDGLFSRNNTEALIQGLTVRFNRGTNLVIVNDYSSLPTEPAANTFYATPKDRLTNGDHGADTTAKDRWHIWVWDNTLSTPAYGLKQILWAEDVDNAAALPATGSFNGKIYRQRDTKEYKMWDGVANTYRTVFEANPECELLMNGSLMEIETGDSRILNWNFEDQRGHGLITGTDASSTSIKHGHIYGGSRESRSNLMNKAGSIYSIGNDLENDYGSSIYAKKGNFSVADKHYNVDIGYEVTDGNNFFVSNIVSSMLGLLKLGKTMPGGVGNKTVFGNWIKNNQIIWKKNRNDGKQRSPFYWLIDNHNVGNWWNAIEGIFGEMDDNFLVKGETNQAPSVNIPTEIIKESEEFRKNRNWFDIRLFKYNQGKGFVFKNDPATGQNLEAKLVFDNSTSGIYTHSREFPQQVISMGSKLAGNKTIRLTNAAAVNGDTVFVNLKNVDFNNFTVTITNDGGDTIVVADKKLYLGFRFDGTDWKLDSHEVAENIYFSSFTSSQSYLPTEDFVFELGTVKNGSYFTNGNDGSTQFINIPVTGVTATLQKAALFITSTSGTSPAMTIKLQKINLAGAKKDLITYNVAANLSAFTAVNGTLTTTTDDLILQNNDRLIVDINGAGATAVPGLSIVIQKPLIILS